MQWLNNKKREAFTLLVLSGAYGQRTKTAYNYLALSHFDIPNLAVCTLSAQFEKKYLSVICMQRYNEKPKPPNISQSIFI